MKPWDRRDTETTPAWEAFSTYRDLGHDRSIPKAIAAAGKNAGNTRGWETWSSRHDWPARVLEWDRHVDAQVQRRLAADAVKRAAAQAKLGQALQGVATQGVKKLLNAEGRLAKPLKAQEIAHLAKVGVDIERIAEGDPTERMALEGPNGGGLEVRLIDSRTLPDPRVGGPLPSKPASRAKGGKP